MRYLLLLLMLVIAGCDENLSDINVSSGDLSYRLEVLESRVNSLEDSVEENSIKVYDIDPNEEYEECLSEEGLTYLKIGIEPATEDYLLLMNVHIPGVGEEEDLWSIIDKCFVDDCSQAYQGCFAPSYVVIIENEIYVQQSAFVWQIALVPMHKH